MANHLKKIFKKSNKLFDVIVRRPSSGYWAKQGRPENDPESNQIRDGPRRRGCTQDDQSCTVIELSFQSNWIRGMGFLRFSFFLGSGHPEVGLCDQLGRGSRQCTVRWW